MSINSVTITGNLTRDPELRATSTGLQVLDMGVAVNDRRRNQATGEWVDVPNFVDCTVFGKRAEALSRILAKGAKVAVSGRLRYSSWMQDDQRRSKLSVVAEEVDLMSRTHGAQPTAAAPAPAPYVLEPDAALQPAGKVSGVDVYDEDIPF
jgi:single-strand DNA-binding protein